MRTVWRSIVALMFALLIDGVFTSASAQSEKKIGTKDLPVAVKSAFAEEYPKAVIRGASKETEGGKTYYEIESIDGTIHRDLLYTPAGEVYEIEEAVAAKELPEAVQDSLKKVFKEYSIRKAERSSHASEVYYEIRLKSGKKMFVVTVDPAGKMLSKKQLKEPMGKTLHEEEEDEDD
jgi:hypothetical protein